MADQKPVEIQIQRVYLKDSSLDIPEGSKIFESNWRPTLNVDIDISNTKLEENIYNVILSINVKVNNDNKEAFNCDVMQAGIFGISGISGNQLSHALDSFCPNLLYPYARETISELVSKGGFPQLCLSPVNFDALYMQKQQAKQQEAKN